MRRLLGCSLSVAIVAFLIGPWMVQAQAPAQRVIIMDPTGTHAAGVSSGGAISTSDASSTTAISHITSVTHVVGNLVVRSQAGTAVTVTGTSLDVNCTGCAAASVVNVGHIAGALHIAGTIRGAQFHVQGLGIPGQAHGGVLTIQGVAGGVAVPVSGSLSVTTDNINVFHQSTIRHISSVTHIAGTVTCTNCTGGSSDAINVFHQSTIRHISSVTHVAITSFSREAHLAAAQSGAWSVTAHQGGEWRVAHISGAIHVAAISQPVHVVGVSIINSTFPLPCHSSMAFHTSARATTIAHANSGMKIYICGLLLLSQSSDAVSIVEGQGASCATGRQELIGHTTAAMTLAQAGGFSVVHPFPWINSKTDGNAVCLIKGNASQHVSGVITYRGAP